ncbi:MAG: hypothetical protein OIN88_01935 [Candidatus Methanoperedens sp.]|nr:hypothetical protein [Candidatus Methanoperedens sp.]
MKRSRIIYSGGKKKLDLLLKDESAVEGLPIRVAASLIIFSVILGLSAKAIYDFMDDAKENELMGELNLIERHAAMMYTNGGARDIHNPVDFSGSRESIHVKIPDNAAFVVFGSMPISDGSPPEILDTRTDNVFYYVLNDGRVQTKSSIARFSADDLNKPFVLYPGEYELMLELVKNNNGTYVRIQNIE